VVCASILLAVALFLVAAGWGRHRSWWVRLRTLPLLAASGATLLGAHHLYDTYADALITEYIKSSGVNVALFRTGFTNTLGTLAAAPQVMWADILVICAGILLALCLVTLAVSWERHLIWSIRLSALVPLAASVAADVAAQHLYDTYASWAGFLSWGFMAAHTKPLLLEIIAEYTSANHQANMLGWVGVIVTGILLAVALVGWWRLVVQGRNGNQLAVSVAFES
jgi:hypothetical protein